MEFMSDAPMPNGHFAPGVADRVDLMQNIMEYFAREPGATPTGADNGAMAASRLGHARPNPFGPATTIAYGVAEQGHVTIRVYDTAGRVVRTLVDDAVAAGPHSVEWDGLTDKGKRAASGVYFLKMEVPAAQGTFTSGRKVVLLK
jgi:hypothetical protein